MESFDRLIEAAQRGELNALRELVLRYEYIVKKECQKFRLWQFPEWTHSDLSQEVMMHVLTRLDQFRGGDNTEAAFKGWLRRIAFNTVTNLIRHRNNTINSPDGPIESLVGEIMGTDSKNGATASSIVSKAEQYQLIQDIIFQQLNEECREILRLRIVEGLTFDAIGKRLNLSIDQVRYRYESSLARLKAAFYEPDLDGEDFV